MEATGGHAGPRQAPQSRILTRPLEQRQVGDALDAERKQCEKWPSAGGKGQATVHRLDPVHRIKTRGLI